MDSADELKTLMTQLSDQKLAQEPTVMLVLRKDEGPFVISFDENEKANHDSILSLLPKVVFYQLALKSMFQNP